MKFEIGSRVRGQVAGVYVDLAEREELMEVEGVLFEYVVEPNSECNCHVRDDYNNTWWVIDDSIEKIS